MKQFFKMFFASMLAMIVTGVIVVAVFIGLIVAAISKSMKTEKQVTIAQNTVLVVDLDKKFHEVGEKNSFAAFANGDAYNAGLYDALKAIDDAADDNNIKGILIKLNGNANGWATSEQLRKSLIDFRKSRKFVYAYGEDISQGAYYVATAADSIYLNPVGGMELKGFATILAFFKGTLDKLEVQPEIFYAGRFKSATEPFRTDKMSDANREQVTEFQKDFWNEFVKAVTEHTALSADQVQQLTNSGAIQFPQDALSNKLVDGLMYWDQVESRIKAKIGTAEDKGIKYVTLDDYAENNRDAIVTGDNRVAILFAEGEIKDGESNDDYQIASQSIIKQIRKLRNNDKIKAVVLRVNSPGGSALASEVILRELQLLKAKKPLVVSMGDLAASGGYYISCQADSIFALPNTITGSIGVFGMMFNFENTLKNKLGVTFDGVKTAPYADFPNATRAMTPDEAARMQRSVDNIYSIFKSRVATGRKIDPVMVDSIAQGRVWTGTDALQIHLVDALGDLPRAVKSAASIAKLSDYKIVTYPAPVDKFETLLKRINGNADEAAVKAMQSAMKSEMGEEYQWYKRLKNLKDMSGKAMMLLPFEWETK